jgi:polysaccharide biosynthesis transport protein
LQDIRQQALIALRWLPLILIGAFGVAALAYSVVNEQPRVYEATARLIVDQGTDPSTQDLEVAASKATSYAGQVLSTPVLQAVIAQLGLSEGVEHLRSRVDAEPVADTFGVTISARDGDPSAAQALATALAEEERSRVREVLITPQVNKADAEIAAAQQRLRTLQARFDQLRRKGRLNQLERNEMILLAGQLSSIGQSVQTLRPSSSADVRYLLEWSEQPRIPEDPIEPRPLYSALLALIVGGVLAVGVAFVIEYLRRYNRIRDERDLESSSGLPVLGSVTEKRGDLRRGGLDRLVVLRYPGSREAEAYRALLARIGFAGGLERTLMVASTGASEGKSAVAANLALAYAEAGRNVVLVDADLRSPHLHTLLGVPNDRGVTNVLVDRDAPLQWVIVPTPHPRLRLMPAGPPPPRLSGPLGAPQVDALLEALLQVADVVVFDAPPVAGSLDAAVLATQIRESVLVVPAGARAEEVAEATRVLQGASAELVGTILYRQTRGSHRRAEAAPVPDAPPRQNAWPSPAQAQPRPLPVVVSSEPVPGASPKPAPGPTRSPYPSPYPYGAASGAPPGSPSGAVAPSSPPVTSSQAPASQAPASPAAASQPLAAQAPTPGPSASPPSQPFSPRPPAAGQDASSPSARAAGGSPGTFQQSNPPFQQRGAPSDG